VRRIVARKECLHVTLSANFRSTPRLIAWLNDRFERILGVSPDEQPFDVATGRVFHRALLPGRQTEARAPVHVLPFDFGDGKKHKVDEYRELEGEALSKYLRWLVERSDVSIEDPLTGRPRRVRYGDIAVLAVTTWRLSLLFPWLDAEDIPYASRGGNLFLSDPPHRQFLLGLRAVADRDDGVAEAALMRPPFFAVDPADLVTEQEAEDDETSDAGVRRVREARVLIRELRMHRFDRSPGVTARELLDRTAFARALALGANGGQRLARVRELCLLLEQTAAENALDYDAVTARLREWVTDPVQVDPPHPVGTEAVHVLTVHQAKGLEFPIVVLWDGKGRWDARLDAGPWKMQRDGHGWLMGLHGLAWEEPPGLGLRDTEHSYLNAERRRLAYVAATRARELLVIPRAGVPDAGKMMCADLLHDHDPSLVLELETYRAGHGAEWARELGPLSHVVVADSAGLEESVSARWSAAAVDAARPRFSPASVSGAAAGTRDDDDGDADGTQPAHVRQGRFGPAFGSTVHHAIGLLLRDPALGVQAAVAVAARRHGLSAQHEEAIADVSRALAAMKTEGIEGPVGSAVRLEYPIAGAWSEGRLLSGFIDLVAVTRDCVVVIDFKTDAPADPPIEETYPEYAAQVRIYGELLREARVVGERQLRCGLLFTADGIIRWTVTRHAA
jgi:ATP-dependent helicase/nuclease subunit A